jgi:hypothetical protein
MRIGAVQRGLDVAAAGQQHTVDAGDHVRRPIARAVQHAHVAAARRTDSS